MNPIDPSPGFMAEPLPATEAGPPETLAVAVCTYRRPESLRRTLRHVVDAASALDASMPPPRVIVIDNDGDDASVARLVADCAASSGLAFDYRIERQPGISAARNAAFDEAGRHGVRLMAMLDDDEWPDASWLRELLAERRRSGAVVVGGPVAPVFPDEAAHLQRFARYWSVQAQTLQGRPFVFCTCNFLIDLHAIRDEPRPLFDEAYGLSGGGDTVFFRRLFANGHAMAWTEAARLYEEVPPARASRAWIRQRRFRVGNHAVHWERVGGRERQTLAKTLGLVARLPVYPLLRREPESPWFGWLLEFDKVRGRIDAHLGSKFMEYARQREPGNGKVCG